jgi:hypothetical protein
MSLQHLDPEFVAERTERVTRGYLRLREIIQWPDERDITQYPLPEAIEKYRGE